MTITLIYLILLFLLLFFFLLTKKYKYENTAGLDKKKYPLKILYGTALFCIDSMISFRKKLFPNHSFRNHKLQSHLDKLYLGKDINRQTELFQAKQISYVFLFLTLFIFLGFSYSVYCLNSSSAPLTSLERTKEESTYPLEVTIENKETRLVDISVEEKKYDFKESFDLFESYREDIIAALLGDNTGIESITSPLHFISEIGDEGLSISWEVENELLIDYSGDIHPENIGSEGSATAVTASLSLGEYTASLTIPLVLAP